MSSQPKVGSSALQGLPVGGASQTLRIPVLPGWTTHPEMLIKAPVSTWAAKRGAEGTSAQKQWLHCGGPQETPAHSCPSVMNQGPPGAPLLHSA